MWFKLMISTLALAGLIFLSTAAWAQNDPIGQVDTITIAVENIAKGKWKISAYLYNDEELAAIDLPLKFSAGLAKLALDSLTYAGGRIEGFAYKFDPKDSSSQTIRFGGLAYLSPEKPPLAPGKGEIARAYISARGDKEPGPFAVDTITLAVPPNSKSTMMLVDKNAKNIIPVLKISSVNIKAAPKKE